MGEASTALRITRPRGIALGLLTTGLALASVVITAAAGDDPRVWSHDVWWASVTGLLAWTSFYALLTRCIYTLGGDAVRETMPLSDEPRAIAFVSLVHQLIVFPVLFIAIIGQKAGTWAAFWSGPVSGTPDMLARHLLLALIGYEAKDFLPARAFGLTGVFAFHHIFVFIGCGVILASPASLGLLVTVAFFGEFGSGFYALYCMWPSRWPFRLLYQLAVGASDAFAVYGGVEFFAQSAAVHLGLRVSYLICVALLVLLRTAGQVIELKRWRDEARPTRAAAAPVASCSSTSPFPPIDAAEAGAVVEVPPAPQKGGDYA